MKRVSFDEKELTGQMREERFGKSPIFNPPITPEENWIALFNGENPLWMPLSSDSKGITPRVDPDNIARAFVFDGGEPYNAELYGGKDMFGIEWVFVPLVGGSTVLPGAPYMDDAVSACLAVFTPESVHFPALDVSVILLTFRLL